MDWGILIPLAGIGIGGLAIWTKHQAKMAELGRSSGADSSAQQAATIRALEERVQVLERIVTDKRTDLAAQIEALRDPASVGQAAKD